MSAPKSELTYYLCGGTGINIGDLIKQTAKALGNKKATFVGLDASEANIPVSEFPIERISLPDDPNQTAKGSGKIQSTNYEAAQPFVDSALAKHKPGVFNIVVCNLTGGTGSLLALLTFRYLKNKGLPAVGVFIGDQTSQVEFANGVNTLTWFSNQVRPELLNMPIPYLEFWNTENEKRGETNKRVADRCDMLSLFLTESNGEMDYQDIKNFLEYSRYQQIPPALSRISFLDQRIFEEGDGFQGRMPIAVASLFTSSDDVVPRFKGVAVRTTGVFADQNNRPGNVKELHMLLDHGEAVKELEAQMEELDALKAQTKKTYVPQKDLSGGAKLDGNGLSFV